MKKVPVWLFIIRIIAYLVVGVGLVVSQVFHVQISHEWQPIVLAVYLPFAVLAVVDAFIRAILQLREQILETMTRGPDATH